MKGAALYLSTTSFAEVLMECSSLLDLIKDVHQKVQSNHWRDLKNIWGEVCEGYYGLSCLK